MNTPSEILRKHEDANEMHFHEVDRKFIIEAMEEYAKEKSEKPINLSSQQTAVEWLVEQIKSDQNQKSLSASEWMQVINHAKQIERVQIIEAYASGSNDRLKNRINEQYYNETYNKNKQ